MCRTSSNLNINTHASIFSIIYIALFRKYESIFRITRGYWFGVGIGVFDAIVWTGYLPLTPPIEFAPSSSPLPHTVTVFVYQLN